MLSAKHLPRKIPGERIEIFLKRHWFIFISKMFFYFILLILPIALYLLIGEDLYGRYDGSVQRPILILIASVYSLCIWLFWANSFMNNFLDYWIVTNNRIINIDQRGMFYRSVGELKLERIQDVTSEVKGFIPTILHYGDIYVQTAGTAQNFVFRQVPQATQVAQDILHLVERCKHSHS